jgi:Splicing factor
MATKKKEWRSAVDPKTGRTYYYDVVTRETQWRKPMELATPEERSRIEETRRKQKEFFRSMEANILKAMNRGHVPGMDNRPMEEDVVKPLPSSKNAVMFQEHYQSNSRSSRKNSSKLILANNRINKPTLIRTISSMNDELIAELTQNHEGDKEGISSPPGMISPDSITNTAFFDISSSFSKSFSKSCPSLIDSPPHLVDHSTTVIRNSPARNLDRFDSDKNAQQQRISPNMKVSKHLEKPIMMKRNTCGSLYISDTMADPDKDACIKVSKCLWFQNNLTLTLEIYSLHVPSYHIDSAFVVCFERTLCSLQKTRNAVVNISHIFKNTRFSMMMSMIVNQHIALVLLSSK